MTLETSDSDPPAPRATPTYEWDSDTALEQIRAISENARTTWFGLLALMTFVLVTLLGVQDIDFFGYGRFTQLPLVNVQVPTELFFWAGPPLAAASYAYFHFYLLRLWDALGRAPATHRGDPFSEHVFPWLLTDAALRRKPVRKIQKPIPPFSITPGQEVSESPSRRRALGKAAELTSIAITWLFGLIVLSFAWWQSMVAHNPWLSILTLGCLLFAATAGMTSWIMLQRRVKRRVQGPMGRHVWRGWRRRWGIRAIVLLFLLTLFKTWWGHPGVKFDHPFFDDENIRITITSTFLWDAVDLTRSRIWAGMTLPEFTLVKDGLMANADLTEASITLRPDDWLARPLAGLEARKDWCDRRDLKWPLCKAPPIETHDAKARGEWCRTNLNTDETAVCETHFRKMEAEFEDEWEERRAAYLAILKKPDLKDRDLRAATLFRAFLPGVDLRAARLEGANLSEAQMEGADLRRAQMEGANLSGAQMEGADLRRAQMEGANLSGAQMEGANLSWAKMEGANLWQAQMEGANLSSAQMEGANLWQAQMEGANLSEAKMQGANLSGAQMEGANLRSAQMEGANLRWAKMEGADLSSAQMEGADLFGAQMEGADLFGAQMEGANLRSAQMEGANLRWAKMEGANLWQAQMEGANLSEAQLQSAEFSGATIGPSPLNSADFTGAKGLTQEILEQAVGDSDTILPRVDGPPLYVWSCWKMAPASFDQLLSHWPASTHSNLRNLWLCGPDGRKKTGRTADP